MGMKHTFTSAIGDGAAGLVWGSRWNADHTLPYWPILWATADNNRTVPAALAERNASLRRVGLNFHSSVIGGYTQIRLVVYMNTNGGSASNELRAQWSSDLTVWNYFDGATGPSVVIGNTTGNKVGSFVTMTGLPNSDVTVRIIGINGDGATNTNHSLVTLELK